MDWFRWHHGSVTDPKFQLVAKRSGASVAEAVAVWAYILETASQSPRRGEFSSLDGDALDLALGMADGSTDRIIAALEQRGLVESGRVSAWEKRQPRREDETANDRKRRQREHERSLEIASAEAKSHGDVTQCHAMSRTVTLEEKREEEKEQKHVPQAAPASGRFAEFWAAYPVKKGKANAEKAWKRKRLDAIADEIIADVRQRLTRDRDWIRGYIPHGSTYVNAEGWRDGLPMAQPQPDATVKPPAQDFGALDKVRAAMPAITPEQRAARIAALKGGQMSIE